MTIRYYLHAWQGLLMFIAGLISVLAAFGGYLQSGGGEELLRRAFAKLKTGKAQFDAIHFNWKTGRMVAENVRHVDFAWPSAEQPLARLSGLQMRELALKFELLPWPPAIESVTVRGMPDVNIALSDGLLQSGPVRDLESAPAETLIFEDCNLKLTIGTVGPLQLTGCSGELRRGKDGQPHGAFSLRQLNGKPFNFKLETLEDGRWILTGDNIHIDTSETLSSKENPFAGKLDPVGLLVRALFSGEMGAKGKVSSLRLVLQPASAKRPFSCDGEIGYDELQLALPKPEQATGPAIPIWLEKLLGAGENLWPRWMQVDSIRTGKGGRVTFHMADGVLNFACDEGPGSAFTGYKFGRSLPPLESLKGAVETGPDGRPRNIVLRGFMGDATTFETRIRRADDGSRTYEMLLEPRPGDASRVIFGRPLWRLASRVNEYIDVKTPPQDESGKRTLVAFEIESDARHFPWPDLLPLGMQDVSGHLYAKGRFMEGLRLRLDTITLDDRGALTYGDVAGPQNLPASDFRPLWQALEAFFGSSSPWDLRDAALQGSADVEFGTDMRWQRLLLKNMTLRSGVITHAGLTSDVGVPGVVISATQKRDADQSEITITAAVPNLWDIKLLGNWRCGQAGSGEFTLIERDVPLVLHPQRATLDAKHVSSDHRRVNRVTVVTVNGDKVQREVK